MPTDEFIQRQNKFRRLPSLMYSSCSRTNMWWLKNCCSFSLQKLMHICSNPLKSKISNPAMSNTPMKVILDELKPNHDIQCLNRLNIFLHLPEMLFFIPLDFKMRSIRLFLTSLYEQVVKLGKVISSTQSRYFQ